MAKIIPAILAKTKKEFEHKLKVVRGFAEEIQLDIMDGKFVPNTTWGDPEEIKKMNLPPYEVHLMVNSPERSVDAWMEAGAKRIIFHFEAESSPRSLIEKIKKAGSKAGIAINPQTPTGKIFNLFDILDAVLIMGVNPGFSGQKLGPETIQKVAEVRKFQSSMSIEVDGGVTLENAKQLADAGATALIAASSIFASVDPKSAYKKLFKKIN